MAVEAEGFVLRHVGMDLDFYHPMSTALSVSPETEDIYGAEKEHAAIFVRNRDGERFSVEDLMKVFLSRSELPLREFVTEGAPGRGKSLARAVLPMTFPEGMVHVETIDGPVDLRKLMIAVELEPTGRSGEAAGA